MKQTFTIIIATFLNLIAFAQYPSSNIYVMDMYRVGEDYFKFYNPIFVNSDNLNGYNNQPHFINDDELLVTSSRDGQQTDIYSYNFQTLAVTQLTNTKEISEFSPTIIPGTSKKFSAVCIEEDGETQRLWKYTYGGKNIVRQLILDEIFNVGYHEWLNTNQLALFIVGEPHSLKVANVITQAVKTYSTDIGRCMRTLSNGDLVYVQKSSDGWSLKRLDIANLASTTIAPTLLESEDFEILSDDTILMARGDKLYKLHADRDRQWTMIGDFESFNIDEITRIAVSNNKIAIVGTDKK